MGDVRRLRAEAHARIRLSACLVQIQLLRVAEVPWRELRRGQSVGAGSVDPVGYRGGNGGIVLRDEVAPDGHEGFVEVRPLIGHRRPKVGCHVGSVPGADDGVLVFIRYTVVVREGFGEPVGRADKSRFCVQVLEERQCCRSSPRRIHY